MQMNVAEAKGKLSQLLAVVNSQLLRFPLRSGTSFVGMRGATS